MYGSAYSRFEAIYKSKGNDDCRTFFDKMKQTLPPVFADEVTVDDLLESGRFPGRFFILLDQMPEERWKTLGTRLDVDSQTLEGIKIDCVAPHENPAQEAMELIYTSQPTMTINTFKEKLKKIRREDITKRILKDLPSK